MEKNIVSLTDSYESNSSDWDFIERKISDKLLKKIEKNDVKIEKILLIQEKILNNINNVVNESKKYMEENRIIYTDLIKNCYLMQKETKDLVNENRNEFLTILNDLFKNNESSKDNPINNLRIDNHLWRKYSHKNLPTMKNYISNILNNNSL